MFNDLECADCNKYPDALNKQSTQAATPLRIGFLTERLLLGFGVDLVVDEQASRLAARGHDVTVFTTKTDALYQRTGYRVVTLPQALNTSLDPFSPHFAAPALAFLEQQPVDLWVIHSPPFYDWAQYLAAPAILWEHGTPDGHFFTGKLSRSVERMKQHRYHDIYGKLRPQDRIGAISDYIRKDLPPAVQHQAVTIHNGGDHYGAASADDVAAFRQKYGIPPAARSILWVGRIALEDDWQPYKGLQEMFAAADWLRRNHPEVKMVVVGKAEDAAKAALLERGIIPALNLPREEMPAAYRSADLYLNTSHWEGFNLALVEAQYQATPVLAYDIGAHPEVVAHLQSGVLVPEGGDMLAELDRLLSDDAALRELAAGALAHARRFNWDKNARELEQLALSIAPDPASTPVAAFRPARLPYRLWRYRNVADQLGWWFLARTGVKALFRKLS